MKSTILLATSGLVLTSTLVLALALGGCDRGDAHPRPPSGSAPGARVSGRVPAPIDGAEAHRLVAAGAFLLDVRTPGEFSAGHAQGATNIPISQLESRISELPRDKVVVTYCASGARSRSAATLLRAERFEVRDLRTLSAWNQAE